MATLDLNPGTIHQLEWEITRAHPQFVFIRAMLDQDVWEEMCVAAEKPRELIAAGMLEPEDWAIFTMLLMLEASED